MSFDDKEDSRFSFITVNSLGDSQADQVNKMKSTMVEYPSISEELKPKQELISISMNEQEKSEFMPLQINMNSNKYSQPYIIIEDKGEKRD